MVRLVLALCLAVSVSAQGPRALVPEGPVRELPPRQKRWAVLIGVDAYASKQINTLFGAANDARGMKKVLVEKAGVPEDQVFVVATGEGGDYEPTRANILATISHALQMVPTDGLLWIQFSGHGIERGGRAFLLPQDARLSNDPALLEDTAVSLAGLRRRIQDRGVAQVLILLDACRNEPGARADMKNPLTKGFVEGLRFDLRNEGVQAFATIFATKMNERAWEDTALKRGHFSWLAEEGLRGAAANERGDVTLLSLIQYLEREVPKRVKIRVGPDAQQVPIYQLAGSRPAELVLAVGSPARPPVPPVDPAELAWGEAKDSSSCAVLKAFVAEFGGSVYGGAARVRMARVCEGVVDAAKVAAEFAEGRRLYEVDQDVRAFAIFQRLGESGHAPSQAMQGQMLASGVGTDANVSKGKQLVERALSSGAAEALWAKAKLLEDGIGFPKDETAALRFLRDAALAGDAFAMNTLGIRYAKGDRINADPNAASYWYRKAAEAGSLFGQSNLGARLEKGTGVARDEQAAVQWYSKAAEAGLPAAMYNLGRCLDYGIGAKQNHVSAAEWYRRAADAGHTGAMNNLGVLYAKGDGVSKDSTTAVKWYRRAAEGGNALGMANLSDKLRAGEGVAKDVAEADRWMAKAKAAGYKEK